MAQINNREKRKRRIRGKVSGSAERPRLTVFRSLGHMYVQVVDDVEGKTLASCSSLSKELKDQVKDKNKTETASAVGEAIAQACQKKGISKVVFDRNGYLYHGRVKAVADGARKGGLIF